jgi:hypothetical protein
MISVPQKFVYFLSHSERSATMKGSQQTAFRIAVVVVAVAAFMVSPEFPPSKGMEARPAGSVQRGNDRADTTPVSDKMIAVKFSYEDGDWAQAFQLEGGLIRVEIFGKAIYGFSPIITDQASGAVAIKVYEISKASDVNGTVSETLNEVQTLGTGMVNGKLLTSYADANESFKIEVIDVQPASQAEMNAVTEPDYVSATRKCCATCGNRETCACRVQTLCGGCCSGGCCRSTA